MKKFITWKCALCEAIFKFEAGMMPLRCPDCLSAQEYLHCIEQDLPEEDTGKNVHQ